MEYRILGRTGLRVSAFGVGTWQLSGPLDVDGLPDGYPDGGEQHAVDIIRACGDLGINLIDVAEMYGDGEGERRVGQAIRGSRDRWIVCTKFGLRRGPQGERIIDAGPETIAQSLEGSLRRLQTDYVDVYLYHSPPREPDIERGRAVLESLRRDGKIRFYGISSNDIQVLRTLRHSGIEVVLFSQSLLRPAPEIRELVREHELGGLVRGALEGGRLTGRFFAARPEFPKTDIRSRTLRDQDFTRFAEFRRLVPQNGTILAFALRYVLDFETTHSIILGARSFEGYRRALEAFALPPLGPRLRAKSEALGWRLARPKNSVISIARGMLRSLRPS